MAATPGVDTTKPEYLNWVKAGLVLRELKTGIEGFLDGAMRRVHGDLLAATQRQLGITALTCTSCDSNKLRNPRYTCPKGICTFIKQQVDTRHAFGKANLNNTDVTLWLDPTKYWEIAKCFLANGYSDKQSAVETDCAGLLSLLLNCLDLYTLMAEDLTQPGNAVSEVRDLRNGIMHSGSLSLATADLQQLIQKCLAILFDSKCLQHQPAAQVAAGVISKIEADGLTVTFADQVIVLQEAKQVARDALRLQSLESEVKTLKVTQTLLGDKLATQETALNTQEATLKTHDAQLKTQESTLKTQDAKLKTHDDTLKTHDAQLKTQESTLKTQDAKLKTHDDTLKTQESTLKTQDATLKTHDDTLKTQESTLKTQDTKLKTHDDTLKTQESTLKTQDATLKIQESTLKTRDAALKTHGTTLKTHESRLTTLEDRQTALDVRLTTHKDRSFEAHQISMIDSLLQRVSELELRETDAKANASGGPRTINVGGAGAVNVFSGASITKPDSRGQATREQDETEFKQFMIEKVTKKLNTVNICDWCWDIKIEDIYTPLRRRHDLEKEMTERDLFGNRQHDNVTSKQRTENKLIESEDEIFMKNGQQQVDIYVLGKAGIGKTLFLMKLFQSWCRLQTSLPASKLDHILAKFDFVFHVSLRYAGKSDTLREMIYRQACFQINQHITVAQEVLQSRDIPCLILVDGLDEWEATASAVSSGIPDREGLGRNCTVLTTSRPWRVEALKKALGHECMVLEIDGLDEDGIVELATKLLRTLQDPDPVAAAEEFHKEIVALRMEELVKIPLMLTNIVVSWHRSGHKLDKSLCMNYSGMIESLIQRALDTDFDRKPQAAGGHAHALPFCFSNKNLCQQYWSLIQKLSDLAFHSLLGQEKERALVFRKQELVEKFGETDLEKCLKFGILSQSKADFVERTVSVSFLHKTFQEYLAALYMSFSSWDSCLKIFQDRCETVGDVLDLQLIIIFLSGLAPDRGSQLCIHAAKLVNEDEGVKLYRQGVGQVIAYSRSYLLASTVVGLENMLLDCAREAGCNRNDFSKQHLARMYCIPDIYVDVEVSPSARKMLCNHVTLNASCIQSLVLADHLGGIYTPRLIMEALVDLTHLQRLHIVLPPDQVQLVSYMELLCQSVPKLQQLQALSLIGNFTKPSLFKPTVPLQLAKTLLDSLSCITSLYLCNLNIDSDLQTGAVSGASLVECQFPVNLESLRFFSVSLSSRLLPLFTTSLRSLRSVDLLIFSLSHTQIEALCGCLAASTSLHQLNLNGLSCRDCGDLCRFCLDLSEVKQLQELTLCRQNVTRLCLDPRELREMDLVDLPVLETGGNVFMTLTQSSKLRWLQVSGCSLSAGDSSILASVLPKLCQLEGLDLRRINFVDQETVSTQNMSRLRKIEMHWIKMSASSWRQFLQTLPRHQLEVALEIGCNVDEKTRAAIRFSPRYKITRSDDRYKITRSDDILRFLTVPGDDLGVHESEFPTII